MQIFSVQLDGGSIEDAFIYRTTLYCWTLDQRLRIYAVADIESALEGQAHEEGRAAAYSLFHSRGIGASAGQRQAAIAFAKHRGVHISLDATNLPYLEVTVGADTGSVLDMLIYYDRLYLATDGGFFAVDVDLSSGEKPRVAAHRSIRDTCYAVAGGLGAVAASCGVAGLRLLYDSYHIVEPKARKVADLSLRAEIGFGSVVNHMSRSEFEFFAASTQASPSGRGRVLTDVRRVRTQRSDTLPDYILSDEGGIQLTMWDQSRMLVFEDGLVRSVSVIATDNERRFNRGRTLVARTPTRIISVSRIGHHLAVETSEDVLVLAEGDERPRQVSTGPIVSLRSYQKSYRYRRLATATGKSGLWLVGISRRAGLDS